MIFFNPASPLIKIGTILKAGKTFVTIDFIHKTKKNFIVGFKEIKLRVIADSLRETILEIDTKKLPVLDNDEFYFYELINMKVVDPVGEVIGVVNDVYQSGAVIIEVKTEKGELLGVPMTDEFLIKLDKKEKIITIHKPQFEQI